MTDLGLRRTMLTCSVSNPGMKYKPFSRRQHQRLLRRWASGNKKVVVACVVGAVAIIAIETVVILASLPPEPWRWYLLGSVHSLVLCAFVGLLLSAFHTHDAEAIHQLRGAWGEENTRDELRRAKRRGLIWGWVDSITVGTGDIDHLVITRSGGLVAMDSKWRSGSELKDLAEMSAGASRVRTRAQGVLAGPLKVERGQHRSRGPAHAVTPLVVVWGSAQHVIPDGARFDGTDFVAGRRLGGWLERTNGEPIDREAARDLLRRLKAYRASTWDTAMAQEAVR